jgi:hypothetical protein
MLRDELPLRFETRILPVTTEIADVWGRLVAQCETRGELPSVIALKANRYSKCRERTATSRSPCARQKETCR